MLLGIVYGGLVFWSSFAGSIFLFWLIISKSGYARNFEARDPHLFRQLFALTIAFTALALFFLGLLHYGIWVVPAMFAVLLLGLVFVFKH